jgi:hypothetical protein
MSTVKVIDIFNNLYFTSDYNANGLTSGSNLVTIDSYGILTLNSTQNSSNSSTGSIVIPNGSIAINGNVNSTGISNGGTLTVGGGGAFSQDLYIGGNLNITGAIISNASVQGSNSFNYLTLTATDNAINLSTGSLVTLGGISIQAAGNATSSTSGGGITISGGAAIRKDIYVGGTANLPNVISTNISSSNSNLGNITSSTLNVTGITSNNALITKSTITNLLITNTLNATFNSNTVGSIFTTGGNVGINTTTPGYLLDINGNLRVNSNSLNIISASTLTDVLQIQNTNASGASTLQLLNNSGSSKASFGIGNNNTGQFQNTVYLSTVSGIPINLSAGGNTNFPVIINSADNSLSITSTTTSNSVSSGALKVSGGAGINGNLYVGGGLYVNSQIAVNITNTTVSSNSTTGAMLLSGGLSINILSTSNANATSYTSGGALTINGGAAISQNVYVSGIIDIASGSNNLNNINLQSFQFYSNSNNGAYSVIGSGNATRTTASFTPIRFTGWNDQSNPKLTININTIDIINAINATNNTNTIGNIFTTGGNVGINTSSPNFNLDISGTARITGSLTTSSVNTTNIISTNIVATNTSLGNLISSTGTFANKVGTNQTVGTILVTSFGSLIGNSNTIGNLYTTSGNVGINTVTPIFTLDVSGTSRISTSLTTGSVYSTNITSTNVVFTNSSLGTINSNGLTTGNIFSTNLTTGSILAYIQISTGSLYSTNTTVTNIVSSSNSTGNLNVSNITSSNILASTQISTGTLNSTNTTTTNLVSTNSSLGTINSTGITTGNINFIGNLFQNGVAYVGSQWTTTTSNLSYTSGNVIVSSNVSSSGLISNSASIGSLSSANISLSGNITVGGNLLVLGSLTSVNITTVNFIDTNITAGTLNASNATITNLTTTNSSLGTINSIGLTTGSILASTQISTGSLNSTNTTTTNLVSTNSSLGSINSTSLTTGSILSTLLSTGSLNSTNITTINLVSTNSSLGSINATNVTSTVISTGSVYSTNITTTNMVSTNTTYATLNITNAITTPSLLATNNISSGAIYSTNITSTNIVSTNSSIGTISSINTTTTNLVSTNSSLGTINSTGLTTGNINFTGNLFQNGTPYVGSQWTTTTGSALSYTSGNVIVSGNVSSGGLISTTASIGNLSAGNMTLSGNITVGGNLLVLGSLVSVNVTSVNVIDNNITAGTLNSGNATITNLTVTNSSLGTINSTGLTTGNINFTGNLFQNGVSYLGSQWTTTASNLSYTSGGVVVNNLTTGNLNFTGSIYQNGILYSSSQWTTTAGSAISYTSGKVLITNENITNSTITTLNTSNLTAGNINFTGNLYQNGVLFAGGSSTGGGSSQWTNLGSNAIYFGSSANSYVSIGTTAQTYALNVAGIISGTGLAITGTQNSLNSTTGQYIFNSVSISGTGDSMSFTQGGALTVNGGIGVGGSIAVGGSVNYGGAASDLGGSFAASNNVSSPTDITGLIFPSVNYRSFVLNISIQITATISLNSIYTINGIQTSSGWVISDSYDGDDTGIFFSINSSTGQMQYTSTNQSGWVLTNLVYKATVFSISANYIPTGLSNSGNSNIAGSLSVGGGIISNSVDIMASGAFTAANGQTLPANITGLLLTSSIYSSFSIIMNVSLLRSAGGNLKAQYTIEGIQRDSGWSIYVTSLGDTIDLTFSILSTGQLQYSSTTTYANFTSLTFYYNLTAFYASGAATPLILPSGSNTVSSIQINSTNDVTSAGGAALQVAGGVNIAKNLLVGSSITAANINFTGSLYQNGSLYVGSQWNGTIGSNLSYTSGNVIMNSITTANINFTGALYQNGTPYIGSQWTSTGANLSYTSGSVVMSNSSIGNLTVGNYLVSNSTFSNLNAGNVNLGMTSSYSASFIAANNIASPTAVTGLIFSNTQIRYFEVTMTVNISYNSGVNNYNGIFKLSGNYTDSGWTLYTAVSGDTGATSAIAFTLNSSGQILYTSTNIANWTSTTFRFKVDQYSLNGTYTSLFSNTQGSYILGSMQINTTQDALPNNNFGALQVLGGVTISKELFVGGSSFFNTAGSLGINTTNISSTLTVNGSITTSNIGVNNVTTGTLNTSTFIMGNSKKYIYSGTIANTTNGNMILSFNTLNSYLYAKVAVALQETSNLQNISVLQFECSAAGTTTSAVPNFWNLGISGTSSFPWFTGVTTGSSSTAATLQFAPATALRNYNYTLSIDLIGTAKAAVLTQDNTSVNTWAY